MDALDVIKVCFRRWYVMLPVLMMALGTGYALAQNQKDSYYASAAFAFVYQGADPEQEIRTLNPLADNDLLGTALSLALASPDVQESLGAPTASGVAPGESSSEDRRFAFSGEGFTYTVAAWAPSADAAETTVQRVMDAIPGMVEEIQRAAGAPDGSLSTIFVMSPTRVDVIPASSGLKMLLGVGAVGAIAGASLSIAADALMGRRARNRRAPTAARTASGTSSDAVDAGMQGDSDHGGDDGDVGGGNGGDDGDEAGDTDRGEDGEEPRAAHRGRPASTHRAARARARRRADARRAARPAQVTAPGPPVAIPPVNVQADAVPMGTIRPPAILPATTREGHEPPTVRPPTVQLTAVAPAPADDPGEPGVQGSTPPFESLFR